MRLCEDALRMRSSGQALHRGPHDAPGFTDACPMQSCADGEQRFVDGFRGIPVKRNRLQSLVRVHPRRWCLMAGWLAGKEHFRTVRHSESLPYGYALDSGARALSL